MTTFSQSGLWSINVPKAYGGPELSYVTMNKVIAIIAAADPCLGQIPQNHLGVIAAIRTVSDEAQKQLLFGEALRGTRFGNAFSEFGSKRAADLETSFTDAGDHVIVTGRKFYSTGALLAHLVPIVALDDEALAWYTIADRDAPGLTVIDDWPAFGQRTTLSGTVILDKVKVPKTHLVPGYEVPTADGVIFQVIQAAIAHPHAARPGALEIRDPRQLLSERDQAADPRLELESHTMGQPLQWYPILIDLLTEGKALRRLVPVHAQQKP